MTLASLTTADETVVGIVSPLVDGWSVTTPDGQRHYFAEADVLAIDELEPAA